MNHGNGGHHRGGRGSYSGSSGGSSGHDRIILRPSSAPRGHKTPSNKPNQHSGRIDSPITSVRAQQEFTMNSHKISETYTPTRNTATTPPHSRALPPTPTRINYRSNTPKRQQTLPKPMTSNDMANWAYEQELKVRMIGIPKMSSAKQVYHAMSRYGNVVRIDIQQNRHDCNAYVTFR
jgi:RNA-dependent RNA polymerase